MKSFSAFILQYLGITLAAILFLYLIAFVSVALSGCGRKEDKKDEPAPEVQVIEGPRGERGSPGRDGKDGKSVVGPQGEPGADGTDAKMVTEVDPCPDLTAPNSEVFLCIDDALYAVYDGGPNLDRLVALEPGDYRTSDGRQCLFTVVNGCEIQ